VYVNAHGRADAVAPVPITGLLIVLGILGLMCVLGVLLHARTVDELWRSVDAPSAMKEVKSQ
jgi:hypothetical protein